MEKKLRRFIKATQNQFSLSVVRMKIGSMWHLVKRTSKIKKDKKGTKEESEKKIE